MIYCGSTDPSHRVRGCKPCGMLYQRQRKAKAFGNPTDKVEWRPSKLNLRTDRLHAKCKERGGCIAGPWIISGGYILTPCKRCKVPTRPRGWAWADNTTMFPEKGRAA